MTSEQIQQLVRLRHHPELLCHLPPQERLTYETLDLEHRSLLLALNRKKASYNNVAHKISVSISLDRDITELSSEAHALESEIAALRKQLDALTDSLAPYLDRCLSAS